MDSAGDSTSSSVRADAAGGGPGASDDLGLPQPTAADRAALRSAGAPRRMAFDEYLRFLAQFPADPVALRNRGITRGERFTL